MAFFWVETLQAISSLPVRYGGMKIPSLRLRIIIIIIFFFLPFFDGSTDVFVRSVCLSDDLTY